MTAKERCVDCIYCKRYGWSSMYSPVRKKGVVLDTYTCDYMYITGKPRGIPRTECYKHAGTPYATK